MKKVSSICFWLLFIIYMEMVLKLAIFDNILNWNLFYMIIFAIPLSLLFHLLTSLGTPKFNKVICYFGVTFISIIFIAQLVYYKTYLSIFSIYSMGKAEQLLDYIDTIINIIIHNIIPISFMLMPLIIFIIFNKHFMAYTQNRLRYTILLLGIFVSIQLAGNWSLLLSEDNDYSARELYYDTHSPTLSTSKLGLLTTMRLDLKRLIFGFNEKSRLEVKPVITNEDVENVQEEKVEYNVMNINFDELISNESNKTITEMDNYFKSATPTNKNKYTGMFKGKNLIAILGESFYPLAIDKDLTPTLYKLSHEGFQFTNFYNPVFPVSTTDGEYITDTSLLPKEGVWSSYRSRNNYLPFVLGNSFKALNYKTTAYHDHTATYYYRNLYIPNFGYNFYACGQGLNINCKQWPESDLEMVEATYKDYMGNQPFLTYYITVSGHLRYTKMGNSMANKNWSYVKDLNYSEGVKAYLACSIELDRALEKLINHLKEAGILDNTVIALSGDHYPYGLTLDEINEKSDIKRDDNFDKHKSSFILWNSAMKTVKIDKLASSIDVLPTLLNLFGVEYDSRLLMGKDILSDNDPIVIFSNRSFITNKGKYNSITGTFTSNNGETISKDYIKSINSEIYDRFYLSRQILDTDYYRKIFGK